MHDTLPTFAAWIAHCFDHPVDERSWYCGNGVQEWEAPEELTLAYMTRLFSSSSEFTGQFTDEQLNHGFWYLVFASDYMFLLKDDNLPEEARLACLRAMSSLFADLFNARCTNASAQGGSVDGMSALNDVCFMWWDVLPIHPGFGAKSVHVDAAVMEVLEGILKLDSIACQESALHGLGHWAHGPAEQVERIVANYLARTPADGVLRDYAARAAKGDVQ